MGASCLLPPQLEPGEVDYERQRQFSECMRREIWDDRVKKSPTAPAAPAAGEVL